MDQTSGFTASQSSGLVTGVAAAILAAMIVATLYLGRELFIPIALAILLSFVLAPLAQMLQGYGMHHPYHLEQIAGALTGHPLQG